MAGLVAAFVIGVGLRAAASRSVARFFQLPRDAVSEPRRANHWLKGTRLCPLGVIAAFLSGTGWGRAAPPVAGSRERWAVAAGPLAVLLASQFAFLAFYRAHHRAYPGMGLPLRLYRPSDVLHGVYAPTVAAQLMLSTAVGLLCFGLLALLPVPPFDGYRLLAEPGTPPAWERLVAVGVLVPVAGRPPLLTALDTVAGPLVRVWG
jgi:hypothetical protein